MGLLDDLKKQAQALKQTEAESKERVRANAGNVEKALALTFRYLNDVGKQLTVIQPQTPRTFTLDSIGSFENLRMQEFFTDYRKKTFEDKEYFDYVYFQFKYQSDGHVVTKKDTPQAVERCEALLWQYNLKFSSVPARNERGFIVSAIYKIPRIIVANVTIEGDFETGRIIFDFKNVERFEAIKLGFAATAVDAQRLEQFTKLLLGHPNQFRLGAQLLL